MKYYLYSLIILYFSCGNIWGQQSPYFKSHQFVNSVIETKKKEWSDLALSIWNYAEVGYQEFKSSGALQAKLKQAGFTIEKVEGIPTAFVATYGEGEPTIGILGEYDALPGLSQEIAFERKPIKNQEAGHACGHHLLGVGAVAAATATAKWLNKTKKRGTIKFFGCPAEEGGSGKVYMAKAGVFSDIDAMLHWHPGDENLATTNFSLANKSGKFRFKGVSAHASSAPDKGRSALDGVEAMNYMVNMMREHIPTESRIHYVITQGGKAPNIVPDHATVYYYVRHPNKNEVIRIWDWVVDIAAAAAKGTQTTVSTEIIGGTYNLLPNEPLAKRMYHNLQEVGGVSYDANDVDIATQIGRTLNQQKDWRSEAASIQPFEHKRGSAGSTDVGDVSWQVPTTGLRTATWVAGTAAHSWQAVVAGGTTLGVKGMIVAAKTLSYTLVDLLQDKSLLQQAQSDFEKQRGKTFQYKSLVGDRKPPLDYRK